MEKNKKSKLTLYFAYGANLNLHGMQYRCPGFKALAPAVLTNYRFIFRGVADIEPAKGEKVYGALYILNPEHMKSLDKFEGFPHLYIKKQLEVKILDNTHSECYYQATVYVMRNSNHYARPSGRYLATILEGCRQWKLPPDYHSEILYRAYYPDKTSKNDIESLKSKETRLCLK